MKTAIILIAACALYTGASKAQLRKCTGPDGRVTYSDVMCSTASKSIQEIDGRPAPVPRAAPPPRQTQSQIYEDQLSAKIAGHLNNHDFERATSLAVTVEHFQMIKNAQREATMAENARTAALQKKPTQNRPTVCSTFGQSNANILGSTYSGTTVCR